MAEKWYQNVPSIPQLAPCGAHNPIFVPSSRNLNPRFLLHLPAVFFPRPCSLFPPILSHNPMPSSRPGGMRGAIESAALAVWQALACRIHNRSPYRRSQICRSLTPLKSPPSAPAHSARPTQNDRQPGFCDFQKTLATAEPAEKNYPPQDLLRICIKNAIFKRPLS